VKKRRDTTQIRIKPEILICLEFGESKAAVVAVCKSFCNRSIASVVVGTAEEAEDEAESLWFDILKKGGRRREKERGGEGE
jgi:hypothetical protein